MTRTALVRFQRRWIPALVVLAALFVAAPVWPAGSVHEILRLLGYAGLIACVLGRTWCATYIGGHKRQQIVTLGPYSVVRNPLYVFSFLGFTGIGLVTGMVTFALVLMTGFAVFHHLLVRHEERYLLAKFGQIYDSYMERVPRWWPNFALWQDAPEVSIRPADVLKTMIRASWFFLVPPACEALQHLQASGAIPILIKLP